MKNNILKQNFIYNITYQILILIIPLITIPYISRVLGADGIGQYSFTYSIVYYFMMIAMLGFNNYGNRTIAKVRDDKKQLSKTFKEIHAFQIITTLIMSLLYIIYLVFICSNFKLISYIQFIYVISCFFDINWFFFGIEKFKLTVTRNTIIKILSLIAIFIFVKTSHDVWIYTLILSLSVLISQLLLWPFVKKYTISEKIELKDIKKHITPCIKLFLPVIAVTIYKIMDKTMLGIMSNVTEVGYYENAEKIINVPNAIIAAFGTVMLPRMSNLYAKGNEKESNSMIEKSIIAVMFITFPMVFGLIAISNNFTILFFGNNFVKSGDLIMLLSFTIIFLSWGNVIRTQYLIPKEMDFEYIISAFLGALINLIMNIIFIPKFSSIGACYGTIAAELAVMVYQTYKVRKKLNIKKYLCSTWLFLIKAIIMYLIINLINFLNINPLSTILLQVLSGVLIYGLLNIKYIKQVIKSK